MKRDLTASDPVRTRVKICGVRTTADRDAAIRAGADAVGFVTGVPVETHRELPPEKTTELIAGLPPFVTGVLVTMPETVSEAVSLCTQIQPDAVQIHGTLDPGQLEQLSARIDLPVLTAVDPGRQNAEFAASADALVLDSTDESGGGGTGTTHDWHRSREFRQRVETPVILAGGLSPGNVSTAIRTVQPFGVDVATGVEREGGYKDHDTIREFVAATRQHEVSRDVT